MNLLEPIAAGRTTAVRTVPALLLLFLGCQRIRYYDDLNGQDTGPLGETEIAADTSTDTNLDSETNPPPPCGTALLSRLTVTPIDVTQNVQYAEHGYDYIVVPTRISLDISSTGGGGYAAWTDATDFSVHVTPVGEDRSRLGDDIAVDGNGLGGFVALDDGFALITRRPDRGEDIAFDDADRPVDSVVWVRYRDGQEVRAGVLTGTDGVDSAPDYNKVDNFRSQLAWNGERFAAYFEVRGGNGHPEEGFFGDKLVYLDAACEPETAWSFSCRIVRDMALVFDGNAAGAFCMADRSPGPGLNLLEENNLNRPLSTELTAGGYVGGALGGVVKLSDGTYVTAWASRRWDGENAATAEDAHDIAMLYMTADFAPIGEITWITDTPDIDEVNPHIAPYGIGRILLSWDAVENFNFRGETCFGEYTGTNFQLFSSDGLLDMWGPEVLPAPMTWATVPYVYANGDLAWAFANPAPDYSAELVPTILPDIQTIFIAHLKYCDISTSVL